MVCVAEKNPLEVMTLVYLLVSPIQLVNSLTTSAILAAWQRSQRYCAPVVFVKIGSWVKGETQMRICDFNLSLC